MTFRWYWDPDQLARTTPADVVLVACPYGSRAPYYEFLRDNPAAIYVEKPIARSVAELDRICEMRPAYALAAGCLRRSDGVTNIVKGLIEDRVFGDLRRVRSEFGTAAVISSGAGFAKKISLSGGGQLFESAIHNIDAVCYAAGIERAQVLECRMEAEGQFDLQTEARIELTGAGDRKIDLELLVTCFRSTQYEIEMEFDRASVSFSLFKKAPSQECCALDGQRSYQFLDANLADYPRNIFDVLHVFWTDFLSGLDARRPNYTSARTTAVTASIIEQLYAMGSAIPVPSAICTRRWIHFFHDHDRHYRRQRAGRNRGLPFLKTYAGVRPVALVRSEISGVAAAPAAGGNAALRSAGRGSMQTGICGL